MNYRHRFHAGGHADCLKHAVLAAVLDRLKTKPTPFCIVDTHAGPGRYDLLSEAAQKTGEYKGGIARLLAAANPPPLLASYLGAVRALNRMPEAGAMHKLRWYPGSPFLARLLMRPKDHLVLIELHPEDAVLLKREFAGSPRIAVHHEDGYLGLKAFLPPVKRRGVVLVDPPFERADEFTKLASGLKRGHRRWPQGIYIAWYPIKDKAPIATLHKALIGSGVRKIFLAELRVRSSTDPNRLQGSGLIVINPPYRLDEELMAPLGWLAKTLGEDETSSATCHWLVAE